MQTLQEDYWRFDFAELKTAVGLCDGGEELAGAEFSLTLKP